MYDFIRTIFYEFRQAVPLALIGFAAGVMILALVNWKYRRAGKSFPKGQAIAALLLLCWQEKLSAGGIGCCWWELAYLWELKDFSMFWAGDKQMWMT